MKKSTFFKFLLSAILVFGNVFAFSQNILSIGDYNADVNAQTTISVNLANEDVAAAIQMDIPLDESITYVSGSFSLTSRTSTHMSNAQIVNTNTLRVLLFAFPTTAFSGNDGPIFTFDIIGTEAGTFELNPESVVLSSMSGGPLSCIVVNGSLTVAAATFDVTVAANPAVGGIVTGAGTYEEGASVTIAATANVGYTFANWTEEGTVVSTAASYTFTITEDHDFIANFTLNTYDVTVAANPAEGGTVTGAGTYNYGASVTIEASANDGYTFANWKEGDAIVSEDAAYTFTITEDHDFIAYFDEQIVNYYTVSVTAIPTDGGTVIGAGTYEEGTSVTIEASANAGYTFAFWKEGDALISPNASYTFTITEDHDFVAYFTINTYDVTVAANPAEGGIVVGAGTYEEGASVTIAATANIGYSFANWTEEGTVVSTVAYYTFIITEDHDFIANFTINTYDVTVAANPVEGGSVTGEGTYNYGSEVTIEASANDGYTFAYWTEGVAIVSGNASYTFIITDDHDFIANFTLNTYDVTVTANPAEGGSVTGEGTYDYGTEVTIEASANDGYTFAYWTEGDEIVSTDASYTFTITENHDFIAHFPINVYNVTVAVNPAEGGAVTGEGTYVFGTSVTVTATANDGYTFAFWTEGDEIVSTEASYTFIINEDHDFVANFEEVIVYYEVTVAANPAEGGEVAGEGTYEEGTEVTIDATANDGYTFAYWTEGDEIVSTEASYTFIINEDHDFVANFEEVIVYYEVTVAANPAEGGEVTGEGTYEEGTEVTIDATANDGYTFAYWTEGDEIVSTEASYTFIINEDHDFVANFEEVIVYYEVTVASNPAEGGEVTGEGTYEEGTEVTIEASANDGYTFAFWTEGDEIVSTEASYTFIINEDHDFVANFEEVIVYYEVTVAANPAEGGEVAGEGTYEEGTEVTVVATANDGYYFTYWTEGNAVVSEDASYTFTVTADRDLVANFEEEIIIYYYDVTVAANPAEGGEVTGEGTYEEGTEVTVTATANDGYTFAFWTEGDEIVSTEASYTFIINEDHDFVANFEEVIVYYEVTVAANPAEGGTVEGEGTFEEGELVTVIATANDGYYFTYWTEGNAVVSEDASYTFTVTADRDLVANFEEEIIIYYYDVTVAANPAEGGEVTGEGTYEEGTEVTVTATANDGYIFTYWTEGNAVVSEDASYTFTVTADRDLVANFEEEIINYYTVTVAANPAEGGEVTGEGTYEEGTEVTVVATANDGYYFTYWTEGNAVVSEDASYTFTVTSDRDLVANFEEEIIIYYYTVTLTANPAEGGEVIGEGTYEEGTEVTVVATANDGFYFTYWTEGNAVVSEDASYTFTVTADRDLVANFEEEIIIYYYTVALTANPAEGGEVIGEGTFEEGTEVTVTAIANDGYTFAYWTEGDAIVSEDATYTFTITEDRDLVANFEEEIIIYYYTVTLTANPAEGGEVIGEGTYEEGTEVTVTAIANDGYYFTYWTEGNAVVSEDAYYTFTLTEDRDLVANFEEEIINYYTVTLTANPAEGGIVTGEGTYEEGTEVTVTAIANDGYYFTYWTEGNAVVSEDAYYTFTLTEDRDLVANFEEEIVNYFTVTLTANPAEGGEVIGEGTFEEGTEVTVTAIANDGYYFTYWTEGNAVVSEDAYYTFTLTEDRDLVANFEEEIVNYFTVTLTANPAEGGEVIGEGTYEEGTLVTVTAIANDGYVFVNWTEGDVEVSTDASYTFAITEDHDLVANFILPGILGDVNDDHVVNVADVQAVASYLYGYYLPTFNVINADANQDGVINIGDIQAILMIIQNQQPDKSMGGKPVIYTIENGVLNISLTEELSAMQIMVDAPIEIANTDVFDGFTTVIDRVQGTDSYMLLAYSLEGKTVKPGKYAILNIADGTIELMTFSTPTAATVDGIEGDPLGIGEETVTANVYPNPTHGMITIEAENMSEIVISNMMGQIVARYADINGSSANINMNGFEKGTYLVRIITGSSVIVKNVVKM